MAIAPRLATAWMKEISSSLNRCGWAEYTLIIPMALVPPWVRSGTVSGMACTDRNPSWVACGAKTGQRCAAWRRSALTTAVLVSPEFLVEDGLLEERDLTDAPRFDDTRIDYGPVIEWKSGLLWRAHANFVERGSEQLRNEYWQFTESAAGWLEDYAAYRAIKDAHGGQEWTVFEVVAVHAGKLGQAGKHERSGEGEDVVGIYLEVLDQEPVAGPQGQGSCQVASREGGVPTTRSATGIGTGTSSASSALA